VELRGFGEQITHSTLASLPDVTRTGIIRSAGRAFDTAGLTPADMDVLSLYGARGSPLDELSRLAGFPGKLGVGGAQVWDSYRRGEIASIRDYCEADCANTYLLYLRYQLLRGAFTKDQYGKETGILKTYLQNLGKPHWREFLQLWNEA